MIGDNMKYYRKERGLSQEELAAQLHVVRQTVSKWEKSLSVPDAEVLMRMAEVLEVSVSELLGVGEPRAIVTDGRVSEHVQTISIDGQILENPEESGAVARVQENPLGSGGDGREMEWSVDMLTAELARVNEELAGRIQKERRMQQVGQVRNRILFLSFVVMLVALTMKNELLSIGLSGGCLLAVTGTLYRNLALLSDLSEDDVRLKTLKLTTVVNVVSLAVGILAAVFVKTELVSVSEGGEKLFALLFISCIMVFGGMVSPKLPFTRHTGLRLPWTVRDEGTWNVAHRVLGYISLPLVLVYIAAAWTVPDFEFVTTAVMLAWIGIPGVISYVYYRKKMGIGR